MKIINLILFFFFISFILSKNISNDEILKKLNDIITKEESPLLAASLAIIKDNKTLFCNSTGTSRIYENKTSNENTKYRTASISKLFTAIAIWQLVEEGKLDIKKDVSEYLGFTLRNPKFKDINITIQMLLSHTSSVREDGDNANYNIKYNNHIKDFFTENSSIYYDKCYDFDHGPNYFEYINMNYCLLGTIIENVTNERFDKYMINKVLQPLNITGSFNIYEMSNETLDMTGTIYRKLKDGKFNVKGDWVAQMDDFSKGYPKANYSEYVIGTNGALYGPQGNLRISISELTHLVKMFINNGTYNNNTILKKETIDKMLEIIWKYDGKNGNTQDDYDRAYAGGPMIITNEGKNRIHETKNFNFTGHTANAYGLFGGLFFDRVKGYGLVYIGNGISRDLSEYISDYSSFNNWALDFIKLADEVAEFDYPVKENTNGFWIYLITFGIIAILICSCVSAILIYYKKDTSYKNEQLISN